MESKELLELLHKIRSNCQYLSHIHHRNEVTQQFRSENLVEKQICNLSVAKVMIQATYLLYTCFLFKKDIFLSTKPIYYKKSHSSLYQLKLIFYLSQQQAFQNFNHHILNQNQFFLMKAYRFNLNIIQFLPNLFRKVEPFLAEKPLQQNSIQSIILKLIQFIKKHMQPNVMNNPDFPLIKRLQQTEIFLKYSDLLLGFRASLLYQIKKNKQIIPIIKDMKRNLQNKIHYLTNLNKSYHICKTIDNFLLQLINNDILNMQKSSTRDDKSSDNFLVGVVFQKNNGNVKQIQKYFARFYSNDIQIGSQNKNQDKRIEKNIYTFEFTVQNSTICVRYITTLILDSSTIDVISNHCANIAFLDYNILIQSLELVIDPSKYNLTKKYVVFKAFFRLQKSQQPLTKLLIALEHVTICARLYLELLSKKPSKDQTTVIQEYSKRLDHLLKIFINKAENFYKNL